MIIHSPIISGSLTFAEGGTFTLPDNGIYSGSFSGSINGIGDPETFSASVDTRIDQLAIDTGSQDSRLDNLEGFTSSIDTTIKTKLDADGVISGSSQVDITSTTGTLDISSRTNLAVSDTTNVDMILTGDTLSANLKGGVVSGSAQVTSLLPSGTISGSSQVNADSITNFDTNVKSKLDADTVVSGSTQVTSLLPSGTVSGSSQVVYTSLSSIPSGIVSGSSQINADSITNFDTNVKSKLDADTVVSGSTQILTLVSIDEDTMSSNSDTKLPTQQSVKSYVDGEITALISGSPATLDTLNELAAALGDDPNFATTVSTTIGGKVSQSLEVISGDGLTGGGNLTTNRTLAVGAGDGISVSADAVAVDGTVLRTTGFGVVSGSGQIDITSTTGTLDISSRTNLVVSDTTTIDMVLTGDTLSANVIGGIVSGSSQVVYTSLSSIPAGIVSGSSQVTPLLPSGVVSGSSQVNADSITNFDTNVKDKLNTDGVISGSVQVNADTITNFDTNVKAKLDTDLVVSGSASDVKTFLSLGNVTNESKATMFTSPTFTGTVSGVTATHVSLGNVTNESKATMFTSPEFTGTPIAPTAVANTNSTQIATTAYVQQELTDLIGGANSAFDTLIEISASLASGDSTLNTLVDGKLAKASNLSDLTDTSSARTNLGLVIGTDVQAYNSTLASVAGGTYSGDDSITTIGTVTAGSVTAILPTGVVSGSIQVLGGTGIVSGSTQVKPLLPSGTVSGSSQVVYTSLSSIPSGIVSGSSQVVYTSLSSIPAGIVSGSTQVKSLLPSGTVSGSSQVNADTITNFDTNVKAKLDADTVVSGSTQVVYTSLSSIPSGIVSGSSQITYSGISSIPGGIVSGSSQVNADSITNFDTNVKAKLDTDGVISGSIQVSYVGLSNIPAGIVSGSTQLTSLLPSGVVSGSIQVNADTITNFDANVKTKLDADLVLSGSTSDVKTFLSLQNVTNESKATMFSSPTFTGTVSGVTATHVGLGNVTNESKATMFSSPTFTGTVSGVTATHVGLGNVTNESKATMFTSPSLTGTPIAPTAVANTNSTQIATTAYVQQELTDLIGGANSAFDTLLEISASLASGDSTLNSLVDGKLAKASNLSDLTDTSAARTNLGVAIGTNVQAFNSTLASVAGGTYSGDDSITTIGTVTAGSVTAILPTGVVSGSAQINVASTTGDIALGTRTSGNYVASLVAGTNITLTNNTGEGATPTIGLTNNTISGITLGSNLATLTIGTGLSGTSYNGSGAVTIANTGVTSNVAGTGISVSGATGAVTITNSSPNATHSGDVTGATALTIANDAVTNAKAANMAVSTIKGRITAGTGDPEDLTAANVRTILNVADGAQVNVATNLAITAGTTAGPIVTSSTGTNATLPAASGTASGVVVTGAQTFAGAKTFSNSTASTTTTTGAVIVTGGVGIGGALNVGGDVVAYASSDRRLKDNIQNIENPIEKVQKLNGVTWDWNSNADELQQSLPNVGVIAQEVEEVFPQLVHNRDNGYKGVDYAKLTGLLIEAIKEQQKQIDDLKSKL